jgi:sugar phosphate isomerase/epimerase
MSSIDSTGLSGIEIGARIYRIENIEGIWKMGFRWAEISLLDPEESMKMVALLLQIKRDLGIHYLAHGPNEGNPYDLRSLREEFLPKIKELIDISTIIDAPLFTVHFWLDPRFIKRELILKKLEILADICERSKGKGVSLCIENLSEQPEAFSPILDCFPNLNITLDIGHGQLLSEENTAFSFIRTFPKRIRHVHLHDNRGGNLVKDDLHLPIGEGIIDFQRILKELLLIPYSGVMTLEVPIERIEESRRRILSILRNLVEGPSKMEKMI